MTRRYGAGSVYQRSRDGKWVASWEVPGEKRRRRSVVADSSAAAIRRMVAAQRAEGSSSSRSRVPTGSVGAYLEMWLRDVVRRTRRERTLVGYRAIVSALPDYLLDADLSDPDLGHLVQRAVNDMDRHARTVSHYAACLRTAFGYAVRKGLMDRNPATDLDLPAIERVDRIPLSAAELRRFLDASRDDPLHPLWVAAAWTAMRQGELLALRWEDVSLTRAQLQVRHSLARLPPKHKGGLWRYELTEPKTPRSRRTVPLLPEVIEALEPLRKAYLAHAPELDQGLVFATASGSPLDGSVVTRLFQAALRRADVRVVRFHDTRHGAATMLIERGVDLATVSALLGHSNIGTTVDLYGHLTETHKAAAMARLQGIG